MVAGLIGIWFVAAVVFYVLKAARAVLPCIPKALGVLLCLPAMPFAVAYKNRETHPWQARCIVIGWSLLYLLLAFILYMEIRKGPDRGVLSPVRDNGATCGK